MLVSTGIDRKAGAVGVWLDDLGQKVNVLKDADGKVTGLMGSGRGRYLMGGGTAAAVTGKTYVFSWKTTSINQFVISWKWE
ncbi:MAG TPA: hypothetical protein VED47_10215 [Burkholderiaceae bacterium]|nr:hypothetical protein [Burkholderiaceae bacterium]